MLASFRSRIKSWVEFAVAAWMVAGSPALRRQVLGAASSATRAVYQTLASRLDREAQQFDRERTAEEQRIEGLRQRLATVTSESERSAITREIRDGEARLIAAQADLGQIVRDAQVVVETGDQIGESWRVARGYSGATRSALVAQVQESRTESSRLSKENACQASEVATLKETQATTAAQLVTAAELLKEARQQLEASQRSVESAATTTSR